MCICVCVYIIILCLYIHMTELYLCYVSIESPCMYQNYDFTHKYSSLMHPITFMKQVLMADVCRKPLEKHEAQIKLKTHICAVMSYYSTQ